MYKYLITTLVLLICLTGCCYNSVVKSFIGKYGSEDFSEFGGSSVFIRGGDENRNPIIFVHAPLLSGSDNRGLYVVTIDRNTNLVLETRWTLSKYSEGESADVDTLGLQRLAQKFWDYRIQRLDVNQEGDVFVFFKDPETLGLVRLVENSRVLPLHEEDLVQVDGNWYKPRKSVRRYTNWSSVIVDKHM